MKIFKHFSSVALLVLVLFAVQPVYGQEYTVNSDESSFSLSDGEGESVVSISTTDDKSGLRLSVGGVELNLRPSSGANSGTLYKRAKNTDHVALIEAGIPTLSLHNAALFNDPSFERITDLDFNNSIQINLSIASAYLPFTRDNSVGIKGRIISSWTNYAFNDFTLGRDGTAVTILPVPGNTKKSKLTTWTIRVPVELQFGIGNNFFINAGVYGGLVAGSHTKYKFGKDDKVKENYSVNPFEAGLTLRAGYGNWYAYCSYGLTNLFKNSGQPEVRTLTFGLATGIFD